VGSQYLFLSNWEDVENYEDEEEVWDQVMFEGSIPVNRFLVPDTINGLCTAYMYVNDNFYHANGGYPVLYSDNNDCPLTRKSMNENFADFSVNQNKPVGWRSSTFMSNGAINSGTYIWFGVFVDFYWEYRFDYGAKCYSGEWWDIGNSIPNTYPNRWNYFRDCKISMYFTYGPAKNYVRTLTQGVKLTDNRKFTGNYKRNVSQIAGNSALINKIGSYYRKCVTTANNSMSVKRYPVFNIKITENIKVVMNLFNPVSLFRKCTNNVNVNSLTNRKFGAIRNIQNTVKLTENKSFSVFFIRAVKDNIHITQSFKRWGAFIRALRINAGNIAETSRKSNYLRVNKDTVQVVGLSLRSLFLYVQIVSKIFIRDYLLRRFLKAKEDFILKSPVCRELKLDSRI